MDNPVGVSRLQLRMGMATAMACAVFGVLSHSLPAVARSDAPPGAPPVPGGPGTPSLDAPGSGAPPPLNRPGLGPAAAPWTPAEVALRAQQSGPDDVSGVWLIDFRRSNSMPSPNNRDPKKPLKLIDGTVIPLRPEFEKTYRERAQYDNTDQPYASMSSRCLPPGTPFNMMGAPYPMHIVQSADFIAILLEEGWTFRAVYMNGKHPEQLVPGFMGHSIGHWEGKTLVIETIGIRDDVPLAGAALSHSAQLRVVERISRAGPDLLLDRIEINDPVNFYQPFAYLSYFNRSKDQPIEYVCEVNNIEINSDGRQVYKDVK